MTLTIEVTEDLVDAIKLPADELQDRLRRELAIRLYEKGLLSFGKARQRAEIPRWDLRDLLGSEGILRRYDVAALEEDLRTLQELG